MINISAEDAKLFQDNGFTKEQIGATINHYREQGLSDDDIQVKINDRLSSFGKAPVEEKKGIDLTPSGVYKKAVAGAVAPLRAAINKESIPEAYQTGMEKLEEFKPAGGIADLAFDTAVYSRLPMLKGASTAGKVGAFAGNAAIQGGLPGLLEGAKEGNALEGAGAGTGIAAGVQSLPVIGKVATPIMKVVPTTGNLLARTIGRIQPETLKRAVQPDSKALDLTREQAQNLLMDTTERIQNTYKDLLSKRGKTVGEAIKALPVDKGITRQDLKTVLENIYSDFSASGNQNLNVARNEAGGLYKYANNLIDKSKNDIVSASEVKDILKNIKSHAPKDVFGNPISSEEDAIINLLYGDYNAKLSTLSPELAQANKSFKVLKDFEQNEGVKEILRPNKKDPGTELDKASRALRNYNSTITSGNKNRNIQDLEKLFVKEGYAPFLNDIDDVNAAMDLLNARSTGDSWLANLTTQLSRPALKGVRYLNQKGIPQALTNFSERVSPEVRRILTPALVQLGVGE
jgi:hypothetical protein